MEIYVNFLYSLLSLVISELCFLTDSVQTQETCLDEIATWEVSQSLDPNS